VNFGTSRYLRQKYNVSTLNVVSPDVDTIRLSILINKRRRSIVFMFYHSGQQIVLLTTVWW
jgi:hypothetical protein